MVAAKVENRGTTSAQLLRGQKALVTGANSGIGLATAIALGRAGADVVVNYVVGAHEAREGGRRRSRASGSAPTPTRPTCPTRTRSTPWSRGWSRSSAPSTSWWPTRASSGTPPLTEMTLAQWQKVIDVNLTGQFLCAREAAKEFMRRGVVEEVSRSAGKIICMSSVHQIIPWAGHVNYASSKGGVQMLMRPWPRSSRPSGSGSTRSHPAPSGRRSTATPGPPRRPRPNCCG